MPSPNYRKGATMERAVKAALEAKGYTCIRAAGSHGIDLLAWDGIRGFIISCKSYRLSVAAKLREFKAMDAKESLIWKWRRC